MLDSILSVTLYSVSSILTETNYTTEKTTHNAASLVPRPDPARTSFLSPHAILKAIWARVGVGSGTETTIQLAEFVIILWEICYLKPHLSKLPNNDSHRGSTVQLINLLCIRIVFIYPHFTDLSTLQSG